MSTEPAGGYQPSSPALDLPRILDSDMSGLEDELEYLESTLNQPYSPAADDILNDHEIAISAFPSDPTIDLHSKKTQNVGRTQNVAPAHYLMPVVSSESPPSSSQDSASETSRGRKRKSSSNSSRSALIGPDVTMVDDMDMTDWKDDDMMTGQDGPAFAGFPVLTNPSNPLELDPDFANSNRAMENDFDFDSAASSPSPLGLGGLSTGGTIQPRNLNMPYRGSPKMQKAFQSNSMPSRQFVRPTHKTLPITTANSREASPLSGMMMGYESPSTMFNNHSTSPSSNEEGTSREQTLGSSTETPTWPASFEFTPQAFSPGSVPNSMTSPYSPSKSISDQPTQFALTIHPTPLKSRVETQIPIKMTLFPMPHDIKKLHLPTHSISKPKLMSKPTPEKSHDTLELHTMVVCTSAMQSDEALKKAFARAAGLEVPASSPLVKAEPESRRSSSGSHPSMASDDENKPLNGGEVTICSGCQQRERKRAGRKKVKKPEEEEAWLKDEAKRVIVFNTNEVKEWVKPSKELAADMVSERPAPVVPEGAMQVDAPMRIACYCRHQSEKLGFQVIFTIKDWEDKLVAQAITSSIMITDDHKTTTGPQPTHSHNSSVNEGFGVPNPQYAPGGPAFGMQQQQSNGFRASYSHSDLQSLQRNNFVPQFTQGQANFQQPFPSQNTSATLTPRNLSRQASPSGPAGPSHKKRKSSGPSKVPSGLAMTRLETGDGQGVGFAPNGSISANASAAPSPYATRFGPFVQPGESGYVNPTSIPPHVATGPPTPSGTDYGFLNQAHRSQSMENLAMGPMFSAPTSAHPSRPQSPSGGQRNANAYQQAQAAQVAQAVANGLYGMPLNLNPHRPPTIHRIIPAEGPKAGGIEVTCLGSGFCQGLEVMFGDSLATTTTFWGERSLVCLLPPAAQAGTVNVTFKHQHQQYNTSPALSNVMFKYVDDDEMQLLRLALSVLGHKMTGRLDDVSDIARNIVGSAGSNLFGNSTGNSPPGGAQHGPNNQYSMLDLESTLLKCLDLIDLDDSPHQARWSLRRPSGQTMLHLACSLGMQRFVAALLARGANPDPRDRGGFSPMHFAALHNQSRIVQKLIMNGADPTMRSLLGFTPADLATSKEVLAATRSLQHHPRSRSGLTLRSRTTSAASLKTTWDRPKFVRPLSQPVDEVLFNDDSSASESHPEDADEVSERPSDHGFWIKSRRNSTSEQQGIVTEIASQAPTEAAVGASAAMTAWRAHLSAQLQSIQQTVHWNLPALPQMPALPLMPNLPDYQTYIPHPVRRISSLVPNRNNSRPTTSSGITTNKDPDYKWWELFSAAAPPPAYDEIYPTNSAPTLDEKKTAAAQMAADTIADQTCATMFDRDGAESSSSAGLMPDMIDLRHGRQGSLTQEQANQLRIAHARKIKRIKSDRNLFFIWIPLLVLVLVMMLKTRIPEVWRMAQETFELGRQKYSERIVEVL